VNTKYNELLDAGYVRARLSKVEYDGGIWVMTEDGREVQGYHTASKIGAATYGGWPPGKFEVFSQLAHPFHGSECLVKIYDNGVKALVEELVFC
jgi:hypothetical protein